LRTYLGIEVLADSSHRFGWTVYLQLIKRSPNSNWMDWSILDEKWQSSKFTVRKYWTGLVPKRHSARTIFQSNGSITAYSSDIAIVAWAKYEPKHSP